MEIFNEACTKVLEKIDSESVDLVVTDPPYHIISGGASEGRKDNCSGMFNKDRTREYVKGEDGKTYLKGTKHQTLNGILHDSIEYTREGKLFKFNDIKFSDWLPEIYRVLKKNTHCYIMINPRNLKELQEEAEKVGFKFQQLIVWDKGNITPNRYYLNAYELILMLRKGKAKNINNMGDKNILRVPNIIGNKKHPTEKPVELMEILINNSSNEGDIVLDPFMGAGATGVAAVKNNRDFIGIEIDEKYFKIAEERINNVPCGTDKWNDLD